MLPKSMAAQLELIKSPLQRAFFHQDNEKLLTVNMERKCTKSQGTDSDIC
jgi:hypothetical protein